MTSGGVKGRQHLQEGTRCNDVEVWRRLAAGAVPLAYAVLHHIVSVCIWPFLFVLHLYSAALFWCIGVLRPFLCSSVDRMGTRGYRQLLLYTDLLGVPAPPASAATRANSG